MGPKVTSSLEAMNALLTKMAASLDYHGQEFG